MNPTMLKNLIDQNIRTLDLGCADFELRQLSDMTHIDYSKERKTIKSDPNIAGYPNKLESLIESVDKKYKPYGKKLQKKHIKKQIKNFGKRPTEKNRKLEAISKLSKQKSKK